MTDAPAKQTPINIITGTPSTVSGGKGKGSRKNFFRILDDEAVEPYLAEMARRNPAAAAAETTTETSTDAAPAAPAVTEGEAGGAAAPGAGDGDGDVHMQE